MIFRKSSHRLSCLLRKRSSRKRRRSGHIESLLLLIFFGISLGVFTFASGYAKRAGFSTPKTLLLVLGAEFGFWLLLFIHAGLVAAIIQFYRPRERLNDIFSSSVLMHAIGIWSLMMIAGIGFLAWDLIAWLIG